MAVPAPLETKEPPAMRERRCIVTREVLPDSRLVRFVTDPEGVLVPDVAARLPGRGMWVTADRAILERAIAKGHFSRAAGMTVVIPDGLPDRVEKLLVARMTGDLGLARRSGQLVLGFDAVARALTVSGPATVLVEASDGAPDGRRKLLALAKGFQPAVIDCLSGTELSLALGRENVVHAALKSGRFSERLLADASRLNGFRPAGGRADGREHTAAVANDNAGSKGR
ncbi:MAG TPA: RNA-binding protein [Rhizomicrobium sp.]|nr:RNA-binding protein [Rhizomicrobium sp.]